MVEDLVAGYDGLPVLEKVRFAIDAGQRIGVLGPNGGGKSTLFRVLLGELAPLSGSVAVNVYCGSVPQTERSRLDFPVSALDVVLMGTLGRLPWWRRPGRAERRAALAALSDLGLEGVAGSTYGTLSGGQRQRVLIARAVMQDARLLLLDEPFSGIDEPSSARLMSTIDSLANEGRSVMIATHDIDQANHWDRVLCLNGHQIAFGSPKSTLTREVLEATHDGAIITLPNDDQENTAAVRGIVPPHHHDHG